MYHFSSPIRTTHALLVCKWSLVWWVTRAPCPISPHHTATCPNTTHSWALQLCVTPKQKQYDIKLWAENQVQIGWDLQHFFNSLSMLLYCSGCIAFITPQYDHPSVKAWDLQLPHLMHSTTVHCLVLWSRVGERCWKSKYLPDPSSEGLKNNNNKKHNYFILISWKQEVVTFDLLLRQRLFAVKLDLDQSKCLYLFKYFYKVSSDSVSWKNKFLYTFCSLNNTKGQLHFAAYWTEE